MSYNIRKLWKGKKKKTKEEKEKDEEDFKKRAHFVTTVEPKPNRF
jgi:hypothetical protein